MSTGLEKAKAVCRKLWEFLIGLPSEAWTSLLLFVPALASFVYASPFVTLFLLVAAAVAFVATHLCWTRAAPTGLILPAGTKARPWAYAPWKRWGGFSLYAISLGILAYAGGVWYFDVGAPPPRVVILIADLDGPDKEYGLTGMLVENLREVTADMPDMQVAALGETITAQEGKETATLKGRARGATLVVWGMYRKTPLKANVVLHFELLKASKHGAFVRERIVAEVSSVGLDSFELHHRLSHETSHIALLASGLVQLEKGQLEDAVNRFGKSIEEAGRIGEGDNASAAHLFRGVAFSRMERYDEATKDFDKVAERLLTDDGLRPVIAAAFIGRGLALLHKYELESAAADFGKVLTFDPDNINAMNNLGVVLCFQNNPSESLTILRKADALRPHHAGTLNNIALCYSRTGDLDKALEYHTLAIRADGKWAMAYLNRADTLMRQGDIPSAIDDLDRAARLAPADSRVWYVRGNAWLSIDHDKQAEESFAKALAIKPDFADALAQRAIVSLKRKDYPKAEADLDGAIRINARLSIAYSNRGMAKAKQGRYDEAIADYDTAIKLSPREALPYHNRAVSEVAKGELDAALGDFAWALKLDPTIPDAALGRANVFTHRGDYESVIAACADGLKSRPGDLTLLRTRAGANLRLGQLGPAEADVNEILRRRPSDGSARLAKARLLGRRGMIDLAKQEISRLAGARDPESRAAIEEVCRELGIPVPAVPSSP